MISRKYETNKKRISNKLQLNLQMWKKKSEANLIQMESQQVNWSKFIKQCVKVKRIESNFFVI